MGESEMGDASEGEERWSTSSSSSSLSPVWSTGVSSSMMVFGGLMAFVCSLKFGGRPLWSGMPGRRRNGKTAGKNEERDGEDDEEAGRGEYRGNLRRISLKDKRAYTYKINQIERWRIGARDLLVPEIEKKRPHSFPPTIMYKSSNFRNSKAKPEEPTDQFRAQAEQLQGAFPQWSYDGASPRVPIILALSSSISRYTFASRRGKRRCRPCQHQDY